ncbi:MAG: DUF4365 domain-containing protein [candidate division Zixibacteria bacterium]|nr:DUF4365 domain-containing protein [candidate division Zixibacteria bacterium]
MDAIWRATPNPDLGIDGQIEFLEPSSSISTGIIVAVQVKSGESYFKNETNGFIKYYPEKKHRRYWKKLNLPVILILHNPTEDLTIYTRVKHQLSNEGPITVSKQNYFNDKVREELITISREDKFCLSEAEILMDFKKAPLELDNNREITGIEFLLSCINPEGKYFELRMCRIVALLELVDNGSGVSIGSDVFDFVLRCIIKVWSTNLTEPFQREFEEMWYGGRMVPDILVSLTTTGFNVVEHLLSHSEEYISKSAFEHLEYEDAEDLVNLVLRITQKESDGLDNFDKVGEFLF